MICGRGYKIIQAEGKNMGHGMGERIFPIWYYHVAVVFRVETYSSTCMVVICVTPRFTVTIHAISPTIF